MGKTKEANLFKKLICMFIIAIILTSNLVTSIAIVAKDKSDVNVYSNASDNIANKATKQSVTEKNSAQASEQSNDQASDKASATADEQANNTASKQANAQANNTEGTRASLQTYAAEDDENYITAAIKDNITVNTKNDNHEIRKFLIEFLSGAKEEDGNLVWTPSSSAKGHEFTFRVNYAISGLKELPGGAIQITIPKSIIRNRDGNLDDHFIMSLPTSEEYDGTTELAYIEDGDYIVVYNPDEVEAGMNGYFEISYVTNSQTFSYKDYDKTNKDLVTNGGTASDPFNAVITVKSGNDTLADVSRDINLFINTTAKIVSTQKRYPTIYREWNSSWMEDEPANSDKYYYLVWEISTNVASPTQPYNFKIEDFVTDLTEGSDGKDYELLGYKLAGEKYYSNKNTQENSTNSGIRYDYVLTRHKKETYANKTYTLKNTETATVDPIDQVDADTKATSSNQFSWDPSFTKPTGHFDLYKYGNNNWHSRFGYHWDYANYDLDKLQNTEKTKVEELKGFKYFTETIGYAYPWTLEEGASSDDIAAYGKKPVSYETWDDTLYLEDGTEPMKYTDYYLDYLEYTITNKDAVYDDFYNRFNEKDTEYKDNETITFSAKFNGKDEWIEIGTYNLETKELTPITEYVKEMTTSKITFQEGVHCTGWKFYTENKHYYTYITVTPWFVLTKSDYVMKKIENKDSIKIHNFVSTNIKDYNSNIKDYNSKPIFEKTIDAFDYARVTYWDSEITKKVTAVSNNVAKRIYTISWKVNAWETATSGSGKAEYIRQDSGIFYDLIPSGGEVDLNSIQVRNENGFLPENEYTYETIPNYRNSGRTMLIVRIKEQAQYYTVFYNTLHSWESMADYGRNVLNPVAYETGNEKITKGFPDNGGNLSTKNQDLYKDLDITTDAEKFIYTEATNNINALTAAVSGLYKKVKNSTESAYSYDTETEPNGIYSYQMRYQNTYMNKSKNLILFDSLENFVIIDSKAGTEKSSGWRGTLQSIDLTQLENAGIDPVVYISTKENLDLEENHNLDDTETWIKVTENTDLSTAKAVAIDMRKDTEGNDFVLDTGKSVTATMYMQAPDYIVDEKNPYTYNNIYINNTLIDDLEGTEDYFIHQDYTSVKYHIVADVNIVKVNEQNEDEKIKGIKFRLYGTSNYGTEIDKIVTSDKNGNVEFKKIEAGNYILQEYEGTKDWLEDHTEHIVEINNKREVTIDGKESTKENPVKIKNKPRIHADVAFYKKDIADKNKFLEGVKFKLQGTSDYGNEVLMYGESDSNGKVAFDNLEKGTYELIETSTIDGYILNGNKYKVLVDENGNSDIQKLVNAANTITKYSHTSNINDEGFASNNYSNNSNEIDTVTIEGAESLDVTVYYSTESPSYDWVCVYDVSVPPSASNSSSSKSGKLGGYAKIYTEVNDSGYQTACEKWEKTIEGDTAKFFFGSDYSDNYYGYYAIITATIIKENYESIYNNGNYYIYNEPYHSFYFEKRDSYNTDIKLGGAKFKLYGCSNTGNIYDETKTSVEGTGYVTFENLESGTYVLKEIEAPSTDDVTYVLDTLSHIVEVFEDGKVTLDNAVIWPLSEPDDQPYVWKNTRNKGQITITKKWVDNKTNDEREEPVIYISTKRPEENCTKAYFRTAGDYGGIQDYFSTGKDVEKFKRNTTLSEADVREKAGFKRLDNDPDNENTEYKIYGWVEDKTLYWWTKADVGVLPANLNNYFYGLYMDWKIGDDGQWHSYMYGPSLKEIDWTGIYKKGYWKGTAGSEEITKSITSMKNMFGSCSDIENLDISWFNNTKITNKTNMEYAFSWMNSLKYIKIGKNFKLFDTSVLRTGTWKNQQTGEKYLSTSLIGKLEPGTYEYIGNIVKYAVQIYGINQDVDENGDTLGLTFGPATGVNGKNGIHSTSDTDSTDRLLANYNNSYVTHTYGIMNEDGTDANEVANADGTYNVVIVRHTVSSDGSETKKLSYLKNSDGNIVTRTSKEKEKYDINIHDMSWGEISKVANKEVFRDAMLCGDTKSVEINLNKRLACGNIYSQYGDGAGMLYGSIESYYQMWNPNKYDGAINGSSYGSNAKDAGGYSSSHIRATLIGKNDKTDESYAGTTNLEELTSLYSCIESDLKKVIASKKVKYITANLSSDLEPPTVSDPIWLFSYAEMCMSNSGIYGLEGTSKSEEMAYQKFNNEQSASYVSEKASISATNARVAYKENGYNEFRWLRSIRISGDYCEYIDSSGGRTGDGTINHAHNVYGLAFGFCIK